MQIEQKATDQVSKKFFSLLKAVLFMIRKGLAVDLNVLLKRWTLAGKAFGSLMLHHYFSVTCRSDDPRLSFVSPREYEFSCSNSPAVDYAYIHYRRGKHGGLGYSHNNHHQRKSRAKLPKPDVSTIAAVQRVLEMLNKEAEMMASPALGLPGFGKSPMVRQLRITDSPFPLKDDEDSRQVDVAAEEFIKNFYKDLRLQKVNSATLESPYHHGMWS